MIKRQSSNQTFYRSAPIDPKQIDAGNRTVNVSFSSDQGVMRTDWWEGTTYNEILGHSPGNVDLTRLSDIGVALFNHEPDKPIGGVLNPNIDSKANKGTAQIRFDTDEASDIIYQKVLSGTLKGVSVGYRVSVWESVEDGATSTCGLYEGPCEVARTWEPFEISIVSVPADSTVGVGRSMDDQQIEEMIQRAVTKALERAKTKDDDKAKDEDKKADDKTPVDDDKDDKKSADDKKSTDDVDDNDNIDAGDDDDPSDDDHEDDNDDDGDGVKNGTNKKTGGKKSMDEKEVKKRALEAVKAERARVTEIRAMLRSFAGQTDIKEEDYIDNDITVEAARKAIMDDVAKRLAAGIHTDPPEIEVIADGEEKFRAAAIDAVSWKAGLTIDKAKGAPGFEALRGATLLELGREVVERSTGKRFDSYNKDLLVREMIQSSVFSFILQNVADKSMQNAYQYAPVTYPVWTKHGTLNDYKPALRAQLSEVPLLQSVNKGAEYQLITMTDAGEWISLAKKGNLFTITREDILNDDMHALVDFPARWASAARMTINQDVYNVLNSNPAMGYDSTTLFNSAHKNLEATNKTAPSKVSLQSAIQTMMLQTGLKTTVPLNIRPKFILTPVALMFGAKQLIASATDVSQANPEAINVLKDIVTMVTDPLLDASSTTAWYLAADPSVTDTVEVAFLNGQDAPYIEQQAGFQTDGFTYKIRIEYGVKALDWRGMFKNPGC